MRGSQTDGVCRRWCAAWLGVCVAAWCGAASHAETYTVQPGQSVQAVINAASAGDVVQLAAGVHSISQTLTAKSGVALVGDGNGGTTLRATAALGTLVSLANRSNVRLAHLTLDGQNDKAAIGVAASQGAGHTLEHLTISNLNQTGHDPIGIYFSSSVTDSTLRHNTLDNVGVHSFWGAGIRLAHGSSRNTVEDNAIRNVGRGGILVNDGSTHTVIRRNTVTRMGLNNPVNPDATSEVTPRLGIELWGQSHDGLIEHNTVDHYISIDSSSRVAVRHNTVERAAGVGTRAFAGIEVVGGLNSSASNDVIISRNRLVATDAASPASDLGLSISGNGEVKHMLFDRNQIDGAGTWAVQVQGNDGVTTGVSKHRLYFLDNRFSLTRDGNPGPYGQQGHALRLNTDGAPIHDLVFEGNTITHNHGVALEILNVSRVDDLRFTGNTASDNAQGGASLTDYGSPDHPQASIIMLGEGDALQLAVQFDGQRAVHHALWDVGQGLPRLGEAISVSDLAHGINHDITVVAWDTSGHATHVRMVLHMPEPTSSLMLLGGLAGLFTRPGSVRQARADQATPADQP